MIEGVGRDKISDLTTNILREPLAGYTLTQCRLLGIPTQPVALPPHFSAEQNGWVNTYLDLPLARGRPLLLVPKAIVRHEFSYDHQQYYHGFVVNYLAAEELNAARGLVRVLKNGRRKVYKKDIEAKYPLTKEFLYQFSRQHPDVLDEYRESLGRLAQRVDAFVEEGEEPDIARMLLAALEAIPPGGDTARDYHRLMVGVVEFLFFPHLLLPTMEQEIHDGRKRIDILMENGAARGTALYSLHDVKRLPCQYVPIECKNYRTEVQNPELDQMAGRFSVQRGKFGIICCRTFEDRDLFIERCRDTLRDDRGLIIPLDDQTIREMLGYVAAGARGEIDVRLGALIREVWVA